MEKWTTEKEQRFWERCGFRFGTHKNYQFWEDFKEHNVFYFPNSNTFFTMEELPSIHDLNALFKYAVPKLYEKLDWCFEICFGHYKDTEWECDIGKYNVIAATSALALAEAIERALEGK